MKLKSILSIVCLLVMTYCFSKPGPVRRIKSIHWRAVDKSGKDITTFAPAISSIDGTWYNTSTPYIDFLLTVVSKPTVQTQYYVSLTYYTDYAQAGTATISFMEFYVNANQWQGENCYQTSNAFYGIQGYDLLFTNP